MRLKRQIPTTLVLAAVACSATLTAPPSGLPVTVNAILDQGVQVPSITSGGDSVVAIVMPPGLAACAGALTAAAGLRGGELVVTLTQTLRSGPCPPIGVTAVQLLPLQLVVHDVPSGTRSAKVVERLISGDNATYSTLASGSISVP